MSFTCMTRAQIESGVDSAFSDFINNTALRCQQINSEEKEDLWMLAGTIEFAHSGGTNTLSWKTSNGTTINVDNLDFDAALSDNAIDVFYPDTYYDTGNNIRSLPITAQVTPNDIFVRSFAGFDVGGYRFCVVPKTDKLVIYATRRVKLSGYINYSNASSAWVISCVDPVAASYLSTAVDLSGWDGTNGVLTLKNSGSYTGFEFEGMPGITARPKRVAGAVTFYDPFSIWNNKQSVDVYMRDNTGAKVTGTPPDGIGFNFDFGEIDLSVDMKTTNFGSGAAIHVFSLAQKEITS